MKQFFLDLISEDSKMSMVRFLALFTVITAGGIAIYGMYKGLDLNALSVLAGVFLASGLGAKVSQKIVENKQDDK